MKKEAILILGAASLALPMTEAEASRYRVTFQGNEARAVQSADVRTSGYVGVPTAVPPGAAMPAVNTFAPASAADPANLSGGSCPTCVPGGSPSKNYGAGVPNQIVTFLHPYTNKAITVPLTLPAGEPTIVTRSDRIIYDYGLFSYKVIVIFKECGQVEVKYRG